MRDRKRIKRVLERLRKVWEKYPDLRIGQLILNVIDNEVLLYYIEDEEFIEMVEKFYGRS